MKTLLAILSAMLFFSGCYYYDDYSSYDAAALLLLIELESCEVVIENYSDDTIVFISIVPSSEDSWGEDLLGDDIIEPYAESAIRVRPETNDMRICLNDYKTCEDFFYLDMYNNGIYFVTVTNDDIVFQQGILRKDYFIAFLFYWKSLNN